MFWRPIHFSAGWFHAALCCSGDWWRIIGVHIHHAVAGVACTRRIECIFFSRNKKCPSIGALFGPQFAKYFSSVGANYQVLLEPWRAYAKSRGLTLREINSLGADGP